MPHALHCSIPVTKSLSSNPSTAITTTRCFRCAYSRLPCRCTHQDWELDADRLRQSITPRTRAIIVNTPSNPSGKVFTLAELQAIADLAIAHDLFVFTDEIYEYFLFDGHRHISLATLSGMAERTITISGLSKTFSITGWRVGYLTASAQWTPTISYFHDLTYVCAPGPFQYGAFAGLVGLPPAFYSDMSVEYQQKRDQLCAALADAGLTPSIPGGAYYVPCRCQPHSGPDRRRKGAKTACKHRSCGRSRFGFLWLRRW